MHLRTVFPKRFSLFGSFIIVSSSTFHPWFPSSPPINKSLLSTAVLPVLLFFPLFMHLSKVLSLPTKSPKMAAGADYVDPSLRLPVDPTTANHACHPWRPPRASPALEVMALLPLYLQRSERFCFESAWLEDLIRNQKSWGRARAEELRRARATSARCTSVALMEATPSKV